MAVDAFGLKVTAAARDIAAIDAFGRGLLSYRPVIADVLPLAERADAPVLAHVYAGFLHMLDETPAAADAARPALAAARRRPANPREAALRDILASWVADDIDAVVAGLDVVGAAWPTDLTALKLLHYHLFNRGDFPAMFRAARRTVEADTAAPYAWGMLAFAYEQLHLLDDAERAARRALTLVPDDFWAQHAIAHVTLTQGRIDEGVATLERWAPGWAGLVSFMVTHLWWHLALFYLSQGRDADALAAYDDHVWAHTRGYSQDQIGAVSLLARLEFAGLDIGDRWADLVPYLAARVADVGQPFLTVHYLYGLARAGAPEADTLLAAIDRVAADGPAHSRMVWREVGVPLAQGLVAQARGAYDRAVDRLSAALPRLVRLGGSHAQRDLFDQILLDAQIRSGRLIEAQQTLELRCTHDPDGVALNRLLDDVYRRLDLPELADRAAARVRRRSGT
ncbi:tetratricopeptide repeat protein [Sphingomonas sp. M6A6_1c]